MTPDPPYYAVIFTSQRTNTGEGYAAIAQRMVELVTEQPGFLGVESVRDTNGFGITVSYWRNEDAIKDWKTHMEHQVAQHLGKEKWYQHYKIRISRVKRAYQFKRD